MSRFNLQLALRYRIDRMLPAECADRLATGAAEIGLVPIAALATNPGLRILPGCVIASKGRVRSLLLVRRASQSLSQIALGGRRHRQPRDFGLRPHPLSPLGQSAASPFCPPPPIWTPCWSGPTPPS